MRFKSGVLATVRAHARASDPLECCGLLVGRESVERAVPSANLSERASCEYRIDPLLQLACELQARRGGPRVLGFYHSHPHGDVSPSPRDLSQAHPGYVYLIAATATCDAKLYVSGPSGWKDEHLEEVS